MFVPKDTGDYRLRGTARELEQWFRQQPGVDRGLAPVGALTTMNYVIGDNIYIDAIGDGDYNRRAIPWVAAAVPERDPEFKPLFDAIQNAFWRLVVAIHPELQEDDGYLRAEGEEWTLWVPHIGIVDNPAGGPETPPDPGPLARLKGWKQRRHLVLMSEDARKLLALFGAAWVKESLGWPHAIEDDRGGLLTFVAAVDAIDKNPAAPVIETDALVHYQPLVERHMRFRLDLHEYMRERNKVVPFR